MIETNIIWISWEHHRRTVEMCRTFDIPLHEIIINRSRLYRVVFSCLETLLIINRCKPSVVITQNPSYFLNLWAVLLKYIYNYKLIIDQHNEGVEPYNYKLFLYKWACGFIQRHADLNIVTNNYLAEIIGDKGGKAISLHDRIPEFPTKAKIPLTKNFNIVFICTFSPDEPYMNVLETANKSEDKLHLYITGNYEKAPEAIDIKRYKNITFTGFIAEQDYINLLYSCDAIIDLTLMDNCLVCGAYEAVALEKPLITSDTKALREIFYKGVLYTDNSTENINYCLNILVTDFQHVRNDMKSLRLELIRNWERHYLNVVSMINSICSS